MCLVDIKFVLITVTHYFNYCCFVVEFEVDKVMPPIFFYIGLL